VENAAVSRVKRVSLYVMAVLYAFAGFNHLVNPAFYVAIVPPGLPSPEWLNLASGLAEIVLGVFLLEPRTRPFAAWGIVALLVAVFPANLHAAAQRMGTDSTLLHGVRLAFQPVLVAWAWWHTRPDGASAVQAPGEPRSASRP
jgi:uncharacterized membrane protein